MITERQQAIVAIATPPGKGAIGVVRISGQDLLPLAQALLGKAPTPRHAHRVLLSDTQGQHLDEVLLIWFQAPASFTGEDIIELQGHGGPWVLHQLSRHVLEQAQAHGVAARLARPGEFTERAFLNHKIDLTQAEAIADVIEASTEQAARSAALALSGVLGQSIHRLKADLVHLRMWVEASLDFPEEDIDFLEQSDANRKLQALRVSTQALQAQAHQGRLLRDGVRLVILGQPNAGKSSLLNALAGHDRAIVTDVPGTTRDVLQETLSLKGVPVHLMDTAGLRHGVVDPVETMGMARAWAQVDQADAIIWLRDASRQHEPEHVAADLQIQQELSKRLQGRVPVTPVWNKLDLLDKGVAAAHAEDGVWISAKAGLGLEHLVDTLLTQVGWDAARQEGVFMARQRHVQALKQLDEQLQRTQDCLQAQRLMLDLVAEELRHAQIAMDQITGEFTSDDLLGEIFSGFCIGK